MLPQESSVLPLQGIPILPSQAVSTSSIPSNEACTDAPAGNDNDDGIQMVAVGARRQCGLGLRGTSIRATVVVLLLIVSFFAALLQSKGEDTARTDGNSSKIGGPIQLTPPALARIPPPLPVPPSAPYPLTPPPLHPPCPPPESYRDDCGLPPGPSWRPVGRNCRSTEYFTYEGANTIQACGIACFAWRGGVVQYQVTGSELPRTYWQGTYPHTRLGCEGFTLSKEDATCVLRHRVVEADCEQANSSLSDTYVLTSPAGNSTSPLPLLGRTDGSESVPASPHAAVQRYRIWWACHLLENGGVDTFTDIVGVIQNRTALNDSMWATYLSTIYGRHTLTFPLSISSLTYFFWELLPASVRDTVPLAGANIHRRRPTGKGYDYTLKAPQVGIHPQGTSPASLSLSFSLHSPRTLKLLAGSPLWSIFSSTVCFEEQ